MTWQPIETAPKDGTRILVGRFTGRAADHEGYVAVDHWYTADAAGFTGWGQFNEHYWPATHWMPLPPPPDAEAGSGTEEVGEGK